MKKFFRPGFALAILILVLFAACDNMVDQSLEVTSESVDVVEKAGKYADLDEVFRGAAERGNDVGVSIFSSSGEIIKEFNGSPAAAQAFLDAYKGNRQQGLGKSMGGDDPWLEYIIEEPSSITISGVGTTDITLGFPDWDPGSSPYPMFYSVTSYFWDDDLPVDDPVVIYNDTPGDSETDPGNQQLWGVYYNGNAYDPCEPEWSSNSSYGLKASTTNGLETSANYHLEIDVGDCLGGGGDAGIVHSSSSYPTDGPWSDEGGNLYKKTGAGSGIFAFTVEYTTDPGLRWYDLSISDGDCVVDQQLGYPAVSGPQILMRPDMSQVSVGNYTDCSVTVTDSDTGGHEDFTYRIYR